MRIHFKQKVGVEHIDNPCLVCVIFERFPESTYLSASQQYIQSFSLILDEYHKIENVEISWWLQKNKIPEQQNFKQHKIWKYTV